VTGWAENAKNVKTFDGHIETITLMPHHLVFSSTREMTAFGGSRTLQRGPGMTGWAKNIKNFDGHIEIIPLMPHNLVFCSTPELTVFGWFQDPLEGSWGDW